MTDHTCGRVADPHEGRARAQAELDAAKAAMPARSEEET